VASLGAVVQGKTDYLTSLCVLGSVCYAPLSYSVLVGAKLISRQREANWDSCLVY
jgi:hypothetical protein